MQGSEAGETSKRLMSKGLLGQPPGLKLYWEETTGRQGNRGGQRSDGRRSF